MPLALVLAGCNDDGRVLDPAPTVPVAPEMTTTTAPTGPGPSELGMRVRSPDVLEGGEITTEHTCDGEDLLPELLLTGVPVGIGELAVSVIDLDAGDTVHLVLSGLPGATGRIAADDLPAEATFGAAYTGNAEWEGPCPPAGAEHRYELVVYAMVEPVGLRSGLDGAEGIAILEAAATEVAELQFRYRAPEA